MKRTEIKEKAKKLISGNYWNIWWPLLVIAVVEGVLEAVFNVNPQIDFRNIKTIYNQSANLYIGAGLMSILGGIINAGYIKYIVNFVRTGKFDSNDIINTVKNKWVDILISVALTTVIVAVGYALFVIPGIILSFAYTLAVFLVIDKDVKGQDSLKKSREIMRGHKFECFVLGLSFIGWALLVPFTLGLLAIWLVPYMTISYVIYYDDLTKNFNN